MNPRKAFENALGQTKSAASLLEIKDDVEFIYDPFKGEVQVGMGGAWWSGTIRGTGKWIFRHRKERVDPAYQPVELKVSQTQRAIIFDISGGFGHKVAFVLELR